MSITPASYLPLSRLERFGYGGLGGISPTIVWAIQNNIIYMAFTGGILKPGVSMISYFEGAVFQLLLAFLFGGVITNVVLHVLENTAWKAIVTGIGAPALVLSITSQPSKHIVGWSLSDSAFAQSTSTSTFWPQDFCVPRERPGELFLRGLLGRPPIRFDDLFWVVSLPPLDRLDQARDLAQRYNHAYSPDVGTIKSIIYKVKGDAYLVSFGRWLSSNQLQNFGPFMERVNTSAVPIQFSELRNKLGYDNLDAIPNCNLAPSKAP